MNLLKLNKKIMKLYMKSSCKGRKMEKADIDYRDLERESFNSVVCGRTKYTRQSSNPVPRPTYPGWKGLER